MPILRAPAVCTPGLDMDAGNAELAALSPQPSALSPQPSALSPQMHLSLYQRDECPLCDQALAVLAAARVPDFDTVWIDDDVELERRYGARVPVLRDEEGGRELDWPFEPDAVRAFLGGAPA
jgi:glutaredoxin